MSTTRPRPDLAAHKNALGDFTKIVAELQGLLGRKTVAYIAGVRDARALDRWMDGKPSEGDTESRLRLTYQIATMLVAHEQPAVVQAWFFGLNPVLDDRSPATMLREGTLNAEGREVLAAAREYAAGGAVPA